MNLDEICINKELANVTTDYLQENPDGTLRINYVNQLEGLKQLGCYDCNGYEFSCQAYFTLRQELEKNIQYNKEVNTI